MIDSQKIDSLFELIEAKNRIHSIEISEIESQKSVVENQLRYKDNRVFDLESWLGAVYMMLFNIQSSTYVEMDKELFQKIRTKLMELLADNNKEEK